MTALQQNAPRPASKGRNQRADAQRNRRKVLDAARVAFAEEGLDVHVEEIARTAGVGVGTVYRHFPNKEDLLEALAHDRFAGKAEAARRALEDPDPWDGFGGFMRYCAQAMAEDRALSEAMDQRPEMCARAAEDVKLLEIVDQLIVRGQEAGVLREDLGAEDVPSLICGLGRATRAGDGRPVMSWERYLEIILAGLRPPEGGPPKPRPTS
jgi:AcrR family transcriptional regulator